MISGKYKSTYNMPDVMAERAARTFLALLKLSDKDVVLGNTGSLSGEPVDKIKKTPEPEKAATEKEIIVGERIAPRPVDFSYNIQIHLPATKDIEVYNAIFKSLREHIID